MVFWTIGAFVPSGRHQNSAMRGINQHLDIDQPAMYQIKVQGRLNERWSGQFDDLIITVETVRDGLAVTTLSGPIVDQAALHGVLACIRDLGLPLLSVQRLE